MEGILSLLTAAPDKPGKQVHTLTSQSYPFSCCSSWPLALLTKLHSVVSSSREGSISFSNFHIFRSATSWVGLTEDPWRLSIMTICTFAWAKPQGETSACSSLGYMEQGHTVHVILHHEVSFNSKKTHSKLTADPFLKNFPLYGFCITRSCFGNNFKGWINNKIFYYSSSIVLVLLMATMERAQLNHYQQYRGDFLQTLLNYQPLHWLLHLGGLEIHWLLFSQI